MPLKKGKTMKRILLTLLGIALVLGLFAASGYAGYRFGYVQGAQAAANSEAVPLLPELRRFDDFGPRGLDEPNFSFERGFHRGFGPSWFPMRGFGFFPPLMFLGQILMLALILGFISWLATRSGWRLTRQTQPAQSQTTENTPPKAEGE
jgi:hypothetical protein